MYHVVLSQAVDLVSIDREAQAGNCPRHVMSDISQRLGATVHQPGHDAVSSMDHVCAKIMGQPEHWALARRLVSQLTDDDTVFCLGESVGFPLAMLCKLQGKLPRLAVSVTAPERARVYGVLKLFRLDEQIECFMTDTQIKTQALCAYMYLTGDRVVRLPEPIDMQFFQPAAAPAKARPTIVSASFEHWDYETLAAATQTLNVDVKLCAVLPTGSPKPQTAFPLAVPAHIAINHSGWVELLQLYQTADIIVVSLLDHHSATELTTLMAALACRRSVIVTRTPGLAEELIDLGVVTGVNPGDAMGLHHAITHLLSHPQLAAAQAQAGYEHILHEHTSDRYAESVVERLQNLGGFAQPTHLERLFSSSNAPVTG